MYRQQMKTAAQPQHLRSRLHGSCRVRPLQSVRCLAQLHGVLSQCIGIIWLPVRMMSYLVLWQRPEGVVHDAGFTPNSSGGRSWHDDGHAPAAVVDDAVSSVGKSAHV